MEPFWRAGQALGLAGLVIMVIFFYYGGHWDLDIWGSYHFTLEAVGRIV
jgi:hypothetical protein